MTYTIEGVEYTKHQVWQWLKAERLWERKVRQWLRAEGVSEHVRRLRRRGIADAPIVFNRAYRRRLGMKKLGRMS